MGRRMLGTSPSESPSDSETLLSKTHFLGNAIESGGVRIARRNQLPEELSISRGTRWSLYLIHNV